MGELKIISWKTLSDGSAECILEVPTKDIAERIRKKYFKIRQFKIDIRNNKIIIIYPRDWAEIPEEIDNEMDIIESWINEYYPARVCSSLCVLRKEYGEFTRVCW